MPREVWHSPCFVEFVKTPEEQKRELLDEFLVYLLHFFAAAGDGKAKEILTKLQNLEHGLSRHGAVEIPKNTGRG